MKQGMVKPKTYGRLGNFLFQAAMAASYAWRHGVEYSLPDRTNNPKWNPIYLQHLVKKQWDESLPSVTIREETHAFHRVPFREDWLQGGNIILDGYWQTEKYFNEFRERVLAEFGFFWQHEKGIVAVHVRRGDYLRLKGKHPPVTKKWIDEAMERMHFPGCMYKFFSDDLPWCRANYGRRSNVFFSTGKNEIDDLIGMSRCEHQICSASTFAWWGAWLNRNPDKRVIIPGWWFSPGHGGLDTSDIVPPQWERLGTYEAR